VAEKIRGREWRSVFGSELFPPAIVKCRVAL